MAVQITVPALGESITEAVVGKWHKKVGEAVRADEPVVTLETDKVAVDVPAPAAGALAQIAHPEGDTVRIGEALGAIEPGKAAAAPPPEAPRPPPEHVHVTPVARRVAEERGVDASKLRGTGAAGRVVKEDVLGAGAPAEAREPQAPPAPRPQAPPAPSGPRPRAELEERVRMTPLRRRVAERLLQAQSTAAILTTFNEVDMGALMELRKAHQEQFVAKHGIKLGLMGLFVRASVEALKSFPMVNAEIDGEDVVFKRYYDIGVAVSGSRGLVVPVIRDADRLSLAELEKQIADFGARSRTDKLTLQDLQGGTFTISNGGVFGSMLSTPILNPPQSAILGMHNIVERPVARGGQVVIRPVMFVALSYDHRLIDGREAVLFLVRVKELIEDPARLLLGI